MHQRYILCIFGMFSALELHFLPTKFLRNYHLLMVNLGSNYYFKIVTYYNVRLISIIKSQHIFNSR